ncbi:MAG: DUF839 domain-containing protein, partial [Armatimonadota bacterium]|nr:DUF839 domain-containing protein [Armatimonadota bacterium]
TFDRAGNLWIATDGQPAALGYNDALYVTPVSGPERGRVRQFLSGPIGCEVCGPEFTPDFRTLFVAIQHPGEGSTLQQASSRWPDGTVPRALRWWRYVTVKDGRSGLNLELTSPYGPLNGILR